MPENPQRRDGAGNEVEPVPPLEGNVETSAPDAAEECQTSSTPTEAVIMLDEPCRNLPKLHWQDFKLIGRCISFLGESVVNDETLFLHYEGYVSMVNKNTITLLNVNRFTSDDFLKRRERLEQEKTKRNARREVKAQEGSSKEDEKDIVTRENIWGENNGSTEEVDESGVASGAPADENNRRSMFLSLFYVNSRRGKGDAETQSERQKLICGAGSIGPIPYVTFARSAIHDVVVGNEQRSSFMSIFRHSSKKFFDMQCLRMYVRRFLVSASRENKEQSLTLRSFVESKCNYKGIDDNVLVSVAKEELAALANIDKNIAKCSSRPTDARVGIQLQLFRAPPGLFSGTGILFLTRLPMQTFWLAVVQSLMTLMLLTVAANTFISDRNGIVNGYMFRYISPILIGCFHCLFASAVTAFHAIRMRMPVRFSPHSMLRAAAVGIAIGFCSLALLAVAEAISFPRIQSYIRERAEDPIALCAYYKSNECRGYNENCDVDRDSPTCLWGVCKGEWKKAPCTRKLNRTIVMGFVPFGVLSILLFGMFVIDGFLHYRLFRVSRLIAAITSR